MSVPDFDTIECSCCSVYNDSEMVSLCGECQKKIIERLRRMLDGRMHCDNCKGHALNEIEDIIKDYSFVENSEVNSPIKTSPELGQGIKPCMNSGDTLLEQDAPSDNDEIKKEIDKDYEKRKEKLEDFKERANFAKERRDE